jgi:hypothetical protein
MTLMRLSDGRIVVHSAIALEESDMAESSVGGSWRSASCPMGGIVWTRPLFVRAIPRSR